MVENSRQRPSREGKPTAVWQRLGGNKHSKQFGLLLLSKCRKSQTAFTAQIDIPKAILTLMEIVSNLNWDEC